ncbi:MAG: DEAD/DEAH box helicase, partial [Cephaloticoccus sp.]
MSAASTRHAHTGICAAARSCVLAGLLDRHAHPVWLVVAPDLKAAEHLAEDLTFFERTAGAKRPPLDILLFLESMPDNRDMREAFAASSERLTALSRLRTRRQLERAPDRLVVVTTPAALLQPVPALEEFATRELTLTRGQSHPFAALLEQLQALDYDSEAVCEAPGHYAVRGGIIDVYPVTATQPYRLDFFGDELEAIRVIDPVTQRSTATVERITLSATPRVKLAESTTGLADYLNASAALVFIEPAALEEEFGTPAAGDLQALVRLREKCRAHYGMADLDEASGLFHDANGESTWDTESLVHHRRYPGEALVAQERLQVETEARLQFLQQVAAWRREGYAVHVIVSKDGEEQRTREILDEEGLAKEITPTFHRGTLNEGFRITFRGADTTVNWGAGGARGIVVVTETEIFGRQRQRRPNLNPRAVAQRAQIDQLLDFADLVEGDFVVHLQHGIAHYRGLTKLDTAQGIREVISLEFDDHVTLHVPLQESHLISRYVGVSKIRPQLGRIGSNRWEKTRKAAERATLDLAAELLRIHAAREAQPGQAFPADTTWQKEFEASFPYTETRDQLRAINETKADMERTRPMDRLICGDVGFGKTEVAVRAAFKAVQGGRQVAVLVPTTVLAQQHLNTFRERMAGYPIAVEMLSRFRTRQDQKKILAAVAAGQVDILVGTHRLLQTDVVFKDLGLVVVDEEQRFGVKHKERFKAMRATVDVLSMSATPIPRTLYMALTGARDLSVIETAPTNRHPIQTIVKTYDEKNV